MCVCRLYLCKSQVFYTRISRISTLWKIALSTGNYACTVELYITLISSAWRFYVRSESFFFFIVLHSFTLLIFLSTGRSIIKLLLKKILFTRRGYYSTFTTLVDCFRCTYVPRSRNETRNLVYGRRFWRDGGGGGGGTFVVDTAEKLIVGSVRFCRAKRIFPLVLLRNFFSRYLPAPPP